MNEQLFLEPKSILVSEVVTGGPAHKGGIRGGTKSFRISKTVIYVGGDVITEIDGKAVGSMGDIRNALYDKKDGQIIDIKVFRQGSYKIFKVKVKLQT